jgi:hypothetical protein
MIKSDGTIVVENINGRDFVDQIMIINPNGEHDSQQVFYVDNCLIDFICNY